MVEGLLVHLAEVVSAVPVASDQGSWGSPWLYVVAGTWCICACTNISLGICMPPCSRICKFPLPGLVCCLPVAVEVKGGVVVGRSMIGHTVGGCGPFHGRAYKRLAVCLLDQTLLQPLVLAPGCSISSMGRLPPVA